MQPDAEQKAQLVQIRKRAETNLAENVMPFWATHTWDEQYGGFLTRLDREGRRLDDSEKFLMMQIRMISSLSAAHRHGLRDRGYLELACKGYDFLVNHMWDKTNGGFFHSVARDGTPNTTRKNTDVHAYALTGLTEHYRASERREVLDRALQVFDLLMAEAADRDLGFIEDFDGGEWPVLNDEQMNLGDRTDIKTVDMHTNVMEGFLYLARTTGDAAHLNALREVTELIRTKGIDPQHGCSITAFDRDWNPISDGSGNMTTCYGLNIEMAWLMLEAIDLLGESWPDWRPTILGLIDHALAFGFDHKRGGFAAYGPMHGSVVDADELAPDRMLKPWWVQAEGLNALLDAWLWSEAQRYLDAFLKLFDWVWIRQIDHECGGWYQDTDWETGTPATTDKGREYKTSFHTSRALIRVASALGLLLSHGSGWSPCLCSGQRPKDI